MSFSLAQRTLILCLGATALLLGGCGGDDTAPTSSSEPSAASDVGSATGAQTSAPRVTSTVPPAGPTATLSVAALHAAEIVAAFEPAQPDAIARLNALVIDGGDIVPALAPLLDDPDFNRRWAAIYVAGLLTDTPEDAEMLRGALDDHELVLRATAAGSLAGVGVVEALPVLVEAVTSDAVLPFSDPPRQVADLAREALEAYTGESFPDAAGWQAWWSGVDGRVSWDGQRFVAGNP